MATLTTKIKFRRDTAENLANIVLADGEPAYANDTKKFAIGDGESTFANLKDYGVDTNVDTNYYHKTGSWSGLTYTASAQGGAPELKFTIPTGTSSTTVAKGDHTHSAYVNQNAFSNVSVDGTTIAADTTTDTITIAKGNNIVLTPDASNDKFTIAVNDNPSFASVTTSNGITNTGGRVNITGTSGFSEGIRLHAVGNLSSL